MPYGVYMHLNISKKIIPVSSKQYTVSITMETDVTLTAKPSSKWDKAFTIGVYISGFSKSVYEHISALLVEK